jgi:hypothetical protein
VILFIAASQASQAVTFQRIEDITTETVSKAISYTGIGKRPFMANTTIELLLV